MNLFKLSENDYLKTLVNNKYQYLLLVFTVKPIVFFIGVVLFIIGGMWVISLFGIVVFIAYLSERDIMSGVLSIIYLIVDIYFIIHYVKNLIKDYEEEI